MIQDAISFGSLLLQAEPFHISFDADLMVRGMGASIASLTPNELADLKLDQLIQLTQTDEELSFVVVERLAGTAVMLDHLPTGIPLRGQFLVNRAERCAIFVGTPWFHDVESFPKHGIRLDMLPLHYGIVEMLFLLQTNQASLEAARSLAMEMTRQHEELAEMDSQLRDLNLDLERRVAERTRDLEAAMSGIAKASQIKSDFLSRVSHELRTPLNAILGFSQILEMDDLTAEQLDSVTHVRDAGHHLLKLVNEILDLSQIEQGTFEMHLEDVDMKSLALQLETNLQTMAEESGVLLEVDTASFENQTAYADEQRLSEVLTHLGSNAVQYNHSGGSVLISCDSVTSEQCRVSVSDTGPGIPEDRWDAMFSPFARFASTAAHADGAGLGLALCKQFIEEMDGQISFESSAAGSTFFVDLPTKKGEPLQA